MKYDFTSVIDRRGHDSVAVDAPGRGGRFEKFAPALPKEGFDLIPLWIADMNFKTAPPVVEAMRRRLEHPLFGYFGASDEYYGAIRYWQGSRNGVSTLTDADIGYENGVQGGVVSALNTVCCPGDYVLIHSPTYVGFTKVLADNGYTPLLSDLKPDANGVWRMDYGDMEDKLRKYSVRAAIICSPHNPTGRVWEREELAAAMELFKKYNCLVVSDEIWSDILLNGHRHTPTQSVSEDARNRTVALYSPSKTFNLAGLLDSYHIIYNPWLRRAVARRAVMNHYNMQNVLSMHAVIGAYSQEGATWTDELCTVLSRNINYACDEIAGSLRGVRVSKPEGTYILYLDCEEWCRAAGRSMDELLRAGWDVGVAWQDGRPFHRPYAIRMNLALPFSQVEAVFDRLEKYVF